MGVGGWGSCILETLFPITMGHALPEDASGSPREGVDTCHTFHSDSRYKLATVIVSAIWTRSSLSISLKFSYSRTGSS